MFVAAAPCRAEAQVESDHPAEPERQCRDCGGMLPAAFFSQETRQCRTCKSDYDTRRRAATKQRRPVAEQECRCCGQLLPASEFWLHPLSPTGLDPRCRRCMRVLKGESRARSAAAPLPPAALAATKTCLSCGKRRPRGDFYESKSTWDGLLLECRSCSSDRMRKWRAARKQQRKPPATAEPATQQKPDLSE